MTAPGRPLRVLLVEDDEDDEQLILRALRRAGWDVESARVVDEPALRAALADRYDAIISDHGLPGFDSRSALRIVREHDPDIPFIIVSGTIGEESAVDAMAAGASDYVMKGSLSRLAPALDRELEEAAANARRREADAKAAHLAAIVESSFDAIMAVDRQRRLTCWNPGAERMYGWPAEEMLGRDIGSVLTPEAREELDALLGAALAGARTAEVETSRRTRDGRPVEVALALTPIRDAAGEVVAVSLVERDIAERRRLLAQLEHLASHDALTGLLNRRGLEDELGGALARADRYAEPVALVILDLDNFKDTNDTLGHSAGTPSSATSPTASSAAPAPPTSSRGSAATSSRSSSRGRMRRPRSSRPSGSGPRSPTRRAARSPRRRASGSPSTSTARASTTSWSARTSRCTRRRPRAATPCAGRPPRSRRA
ncbi:PAS domain S-box protein [Paraconexibacter antarcticus]|uniref:PAS domain S-box protein n=1 Tax=Paraconexibacter antarcticus TaxID=2949664 RepID=A0ABY5DU14_9ACTN|nr:GGDEF domain-containing response regulator [Paraconexibacter antarcticus]UTI65525.1 PAS domain S-box protein [Paraconexibacter antarcticus]